MLQQFAATHNVKAVVVLIGANNYGFADIVQTCVINWLTSPSWWKNYCHDDSNVQAYFTVVRRRDPDRCDPGCAAERPPGDAQRGLRRLQYKIIVQTYSSPIPRGSGFRYPESGWTRQIDRRVRHLEPGRELGQRHRGADHQRLGPQCRDPGRPDEHRALDAQNTLVGRRLCENTVGLLEEQGVALDQRRARRTRPSGSARSAPRRRSSVRTSCRRAAPELLGPDGAAELPPPGVQRRRATRRGMPNRRNWPQHLRRASHVPYLDRLVTALPTCTDRAREKF